MISQGVKNNSPITRIYLGEGTTFVSASIQLDTGSGVLAFGNRDDKNISTSFQPVQLIFNSIESVDTAINDLNLIKEAMKKEKEEKE